MKSNIQLLSWPVPINLANMLQIFSGVRSNAGETSPKFLFSYVLILSSKGLYMILACSEYNSNCSKLAVPFSASFYIQSAAIDSGDSPGVAFFNASNSALLASNRFLMSFDLIFFSICLTVSLGVSSSCPGIGEGMKCPSLLKSGSAGKIFLISMITLLSYFSMGRVFFCPFSQKCSIRATMQISTSFKSSPNSSQNSSMLSRCNTTSSSSKIKGVTLPIDSLIQHNLLSSVLQSA